MPLRRKHRFIGENGEVEVGRIPQAGPRAQAHFDSIADEIVSEWNQRRRRGSPGESPNSWFKRNMYRLIKAYVDDGRAGLFMNMARTSGRSLVGIEKIQENPFKVALFAMWGDNSSMSRHQQRVFGTQMLYAYVHDVEPEHLLGFIRVAGSVTHISDKLEQNMREPGHY